MAAHANTTTRAQTPETLKAGLNEVFNEGYAVEKEASQAMSKDIFNFETSNKAEESDVKNGGVGRFGAVAEKATTPVEQREELFKTTYVASTFRHAIHISYEQMEDQLYRKMRDDVEELGLAARDTQEFNRFGVFRNITTTNGGDGVPLASAAHPVQGGTTSNIITGAFTTSDAAATKIKAAIVKFRQMKDYKGKSIAGKPAILLTSSTLHALLVEATKSKLIAGSGNNDLNYLSELFPGLKVMWSPYYGSENGGSDTAATLIGSKHKLKVMVRKPLTTWMNPWKDSDEIVTKYNAMYRESVGFSDFTGIVHLTGAA